MMNQIINTVALVEGFEEFLQALEVLRQCGADAGVSCHACGHISITLMAHRDDCLKEETDTCMIFPAGTWSVGTICTAMMDLTQYWSGTELTKVTGMFFPGLMQHLSDRYMDVAHPYADFLAACDACGIVVTVEKVGVCLVEMPIAYLAQVREALLRAATPYFLLEGSEVGGLVGDNKVPHH